LLVAVVAASLQTSFVSHDGELVTEGWQCLEAGDSHGVVGVAAVKALPSGAFQVADFGVTAPATMKSPGCKGAALDQGVGDWAATLLDVGFDNDPDPYPATSVSAFSSSTSVTKRIRSK